MSRLYRYLSRYRVAIQADLLEVYGLDLAAEVGSRRWRRLLELIEAIRRPSRLSDARAQDEDLAQAILDAEDAGAEIPPWAPDGDEFGLTHQLLSQLVDITGTISPTIAQVTGGKGKPPKPIARPTTALERARERRREEMQRDVMRLFAPTAMI